MPERERIRPSEGPKSTESRLRSRFLPCSSTRMGLPPLPEPSAGRRLADLWLDATYVKVRQGGRIVSVAVTIAIGVNNDGRREVLGMAVGCSEAETFSTEFLRTLARRGLRGVKLVISDAHEGLKAAIARVLNATWQRCRVHFMRNLLAHAGRNGRRLAAAFIGTIFAQEDKTAARIQWRKVVNQMKAGLPKLAAFMDEAEDDVLAYMDFPPTPGRSCIRPTRSNGLTARSNDAPTSWGYSRMSKPSSASSARSYWNRTMSGRCNGRAT